MTKIKRKIIDRCRSFLFMAQGVYNPYSKHEDKYKFIYIHIPKAAGNGLLGSLFGCRGTGHNTLDEYYNYDKRKYLSYYKFTIVRNPYDRFVSAFNYLKSGGMNDNDIKEMKPLLKEFSDVNAFIDELIVNPLLCLKVLNYVHFVPQKNFLYTSRYRWDHSIDYIGKQEELGDAFMHLSSIFNLKDKSLKKFNSTSEYDDKLTISSKNFIYSYYKDDFMLFGYDR